ncbi:hypothetical protein VTJ49DRAFT_3857 [Mycothermus thermophilus]|uniref:Uncharacterized protein n=1 Tax=Humicola insolens TaxID=85995 RepID=A0ABR3VRN5_HUMIN
MDGDRGGAVKEHYRWPEPAVSRGVSRSPGTPPRDGPRSGPSSPASSSGGSGHGDYVGPRSRTSVVPCRCGHAAAAPSSSTGDHSTLPMAGVLTVDGHGPEVGDPDGDAEAALESTGSGETGLNTRIPRHFQRPPPPLPMTPPALSNTIFPFENRRPSSVVSIPPALDMGFIRQPNQDYGAGYSTSADAANSNPPSATPLPHRRSSTRSIPIGMPMPTVTTIEPTASAAASSPTRPIPIPGSSTSGFDPVTSLPSSYPPTAPFLPPPPPVPPSVPPNYVFVGGPGGPGVMLPQHEMINLEGEIVSVVDGSGNGWTRHTRVYGGGGPCLACAAARARDGDMAGGFYGDTVPLEDRRY